MERKEYIRQQNNPGALLNVDNEALENYRNKKKTSKTLNLHEERIKMLEKTVIELKELLTKSLKAET
jgi:hypothetical protein